jgi:hypothetical protein
MSVVCASDEIAVNYLVCGTWVVGITCPHCERRVRLSSSDDRIAGGPEVEEGGRIACPTEGCSAIFEVALRADIERSSATSALDWRRLPPPPRIG